MLKHEILLSGKPEGNDSDTLLFALGENARRVEIIAREHGGRVTVTSGIRFAVDVLIPENTLQAFEGKIEEANLRREDDQK